MFDWFGPKRKPRSILALRALDSGDALASYCLERQLDRNDKGVLKDDHHQP